jgi:small GTP-binding protein
MSFDTIKAVLIGESGTGKTSIIQQYAYKIFDQDCATSISSQYISKIITFPELKKSVRLEIWDTAGQERYRSMAKLFYKDAKIIIFVYDCTSKISYNELNNYWIPEVQNNCMKEAKFALVANKCDLYEIECVSVEEGNNLADKIGAIFQKTSAKSGVGIDNLFQNLGRLYLEPDFDYKAQDKIDEENYKKKINENRNKEIIDKDESSTKVKISSISSINNNKKKCCG